MSHKKRAAFFWTIQLPRLLVHLILRFFVPVKIGKFTIHSFNALTTSQLHYTAMFVSLLARLHIV